MDFRRMNARGRDPRDWFLDDGPELGANMNADRVTVSVTKEGWTIEVWDGETRVAVDLVRRTRGIARGTSRHPWKDLPPGLADALEDFHFEPMDLSQELGSL